MESKYIGNSYGFPDSVLNFLADFAIPGQIEGVGLNSAPEEWAENLGTDFIDEKSKSNKRLRRDYGLVELGFFRSDRRWKCFLISLQAHRLSRCDDHVPQILVDRYGEFPRSIQFEDVRRILRARGYEPESTEGEDGSDTARYRIPATGVLIAVVSREDLNNVPQGSVWSMHLSESSDIWTRPRKD